MTESIASYRHTISPDFALKHIAPVQKEEREGSMLYTNHSCKPNIGIQGKIVFVAMRDIASGEELTHDWATTDDLDYKLKYNCGSTNCRGTISGQDWRRRELQEKYKRYFSWYLQPKFENQ